MNPKTCRTLIQAALVRTCVLAFSLSWVMMPGTSMGQSARALSPSVKGGENAEKKETPAPKPVDNKPSRFAGDDISPYTLSRSAVFSMSRRETDPFGLNQDPNAKPVVPVPNQPVQKRLAALPPTPLGDIIRLIRVTTIMPGEKKFLVGVRTFSEGDEFSLQFQGKRMRMKVTEVMAKRIIFMNLDNGDTATLETGMLPPGMIAGKGMMRPAGMVLPIDDLPLDLGAPNAELPNN